VKIILGEKKEEKFRGKHPSDLNKRETAEETLATNRRRADLGGLCKTAKVEGIS